VTHHLVEGIANKGARRLKYPRTLGATVAFEISDINSGNCPWRWQADAQFSGMYSTPPVPRQQIRGNDWAITQRRPAMISPEAFQRRSLRT